MSPLGRSPLSSPGCCLFPLRTQEGVHAVTDVWSTVPWAALLLLLLLCLGCMAFWECCQKSGVSRHALDSWLTVCIRIPRLRKGRSLAPAPLLEYRGTGAAHWDVPGKPLLFYLFYFQSLPYLYLEVRLRSLLDFCIISVSLLNPR